MTAALADADSRCKIPAIESRGVMYCGTLRLLADEMVRLTEYVSISNETPPRRCERLVAHPPRQDG